MTTNNPIKVKLALRRTIPHWIEARVFTGYFRSSFFIAVFTGSYAKSRRTTEATASGASIGSDKTELVSP